MEGEKADADDAKKALAAADVAANRANLMLLLLAVILLNAVRSRVVPAREAALDVGRPTRNAGCNGNINRIL